MAQTIKLRRSSTEGKVPTTAQLALGELAINTYDGRIFFEKNDGSATIQHIVTTNSIATGSLTITGSLQADNITIDGRSLFPGLFIKCFITSNDILISLETSSFSNDST